MKALLIDARRDPNKFGATTVARTSDEAISLLNRGGWDRVYFDNDLGEGQKKGWEIVSWLWNHVPISRWPREMAVVSDNPQARMIMESKFELMGYDIMGADYGVHIWSFGPGPMEDVGVREASQWCESEDSTDLGKGRKKGWKNGRGALMPSMMEKRVPEDVQMKVLDLVGGFVREWRSLEQEYRRYSALMDNPSANGVLKDISRKADAASKKIEALVPDLPERKELVQECLLASLDDKDYESSLTMLKKLGEIFSPRGTLDLPRIAKEIWFKGPIGVAKVQEKTSGASTRRVICLFLHRSADS